MGDQATSSSLSEPAAGPSAPAVSWEDECRFEALVADPSVAATIATCAMRAGAPRESAEEFLGSWAGALIVGGAMLRGAERGRERALRWGLQTGKSRTEEFALPIGRVTVAVLCSLARKRLLLQGVEQRPDGCTLTARIPSDARTFGGVLRVSVDRTATGTVVHAAAEIPGQLFDWGVSKKTVATLLTDIPVLLA